MKLNRISLHPVAWRIAYVAVAKFGDGGLEQLRMGKDLLDKIDELVDPDVEYGDPYIRLTEKVKAMIIQAGKPLPDTSLRILIDLNNKYKEYLKSSVMKMVEKVAPESAAPILDILDGLEHTTEIEYTAKS